jgi:septal ring factor EnvC (AmiA/AmiB activator)
LLLDFNCCLVQLLNVCIYFQIQRLENKLASIEKELQQAKKDNAALAYYINAKRKKEEDLRKEEAVRRWRRSPARRRRRAKAPRMSRLGGSSLPRASPSSC